MYNPISWHIEPTTRCTLECPGCDRTWYKKTFGKQIIQDINITDLYNFFKHNNFTNQKISLCGSNGDPIYHPEILKLIENLKQLNMSISISTNGSSKTQNFWNDLSKLLSDTDEVIFGIDGLEDTSKKYRINQKWNQVMTGVKSIVKSQAKCVWQYIVFNFNEHQIEQAEKLSKSLGVDKFLLIKSHRWLDESFQYMPSENFVNEKYYIQDSVVNNKKITEKKMMPECLTNQEIYINAEGNIFPCCHTGGYRFRYKVPFGKNTINISNVNYNLSSDHKEFLNKSTDWTTAHTVCKMHCAVNK